MKMQMMKTLHNLVLIKDNIAPTLVMPMLLKIVKTS
jgi:hypothetical protein